MKRNYIPLMLAAMLAFAIPAVAQVDSYSDTLKPNTTSQFVVNFEDLDSLQMALSFPDSASGRVRVKALANVDGKTTELSTDTAMVAWFGPNAGASNVRVSWLRIKDTIYCNECGAKLVRWAVMPTKFLVEVIFFNDAATYGGFADQTVKYFQLDVRKFRRALAGMSTWHSAVDTLKRSTTMTFDVEIGDVDSIQIIASYSDSAQGRLRATALNVVNGVATAVTADSVMLKKIDGKNIGGGQTRITWAQLKGLGGESGTMPRWVRIELIFDATVTASGLVRPLKMAQIDVRKYRHRS